MKLNVFLDDLQLRAVLLKKEEDFKEKKISGSLNLIAGPDSVAKYLIPSDKSVLHPNLTLRNSNQGNIFLSREVLKAMEPSKFWQSLIGNIFLPLYLTSIIPRVIGEVEPAPEQAEEFFSEKKYLRRRRRMTWYGWRRKMRGRKSQELLVGVNSDGQVTKEDYERVGVNETDRTAWVESMDIEDKKGLAGVNHAEKLIGFRWTSSIIDGSLEQAPIGAHVTTVTSRSEIHFSPYRPSTTISRRSSALDTYPKPSSNSKACQPLTSSTLPGFLNAIQPCPKTEEFLSVETNTRNMPASELEHAFDNVSQYKLKIGLQVMHMIRLLTEALNTAKHKQCCSGIRFVGTGTCREGKFGSTPDISAHAHFLRWDRAGVIISESFNYKEEPDILFDCLWRFEHMSHEQRGGDTSVEWATKGEEEQFEQAVKDHLILHIGMLSPSVLETELKYHYVEGMVGKIPV
ncbi:hypothetical protein BDN70DRAFT_900340 [Pholiota conissans]|uniref:Uncharacterized protein n=1 Tax=Pholiota conissans TaxID=109636 RepID=A0A9P5YPJ4_9AGAR|nr:hypothetical protein BDN70DRAFT_900340 [Pholiota conissans]